MVAVKCQPCRVSPVWGISTFAESPQRSERRGSGSGVRERRENPFDIFIFGKIWVYEFLPNVLYSQAEAIGELFTQVKLC